MSGNSGSSDFFVTAADPVNSSTGNVAVSTAGLNYSKFNFIVNSFIKENNEITFGGEVENVKVYDEFGQVVLKSPTKFAYGLNVIELPKGKYTVTGMINNSPVSQQIVKD
ncbi:T9SS type A sorting domain-containing protein [Chryseobacterium arachidis]|uniref:T9SS type A sorting domain-containing protein n=1 Tax=Chryseobacterium arachidis TaxID=1416778 RepID=UPI003623B731